MVIKTNTACLNLPNRWKLWRCPKTRNSCLQPITSASRACPRNNSWTNRFATVTCLCPQPPTAMPMAHKHRQITTLASKNSWNLRNFRWTCYYLSRIPVKNKTRAFCKPTTRCSWATWERLQTNRLLETEGTGKMQAQLQLTISLATSNWRRRNFKAFCIRMINLIKVYSRVWTFMLRIRGLLVQRNRQTPTVQSNTHAITDFPSLQILTQPMQMQVPTLTG